MSILKILSELAATASSNTKVEILKREKDNELLKRVFQAAYNPMITYGIKAIPEYKHRGESQTLDYTLEFELPVFVNRLVTGNNAISAFGRTLSALSPDNAIVLERIVQRDLRCGTTDTLASRIWPGLVPTFDVMLSHKDISGIKFPAYAQIKSDGARCHMSLQAGQAVAFSRNGKPIQLHGYFDESLAKLVNEGETIDGELRVEINGKLLSRKEGNGIVNKAVKGTISKEEAATLVLLSWDIVDFSETIVYKERIERLTKSATNVLVSGNSNISVLETEIVNNEEEAYAFYRKCRAAGEEGAMIKNMMAVWQPKRSKDIGKMKAIEVADMRITGWYYGEKGKKFEHALGGFICETEDGFCHVNVGGGYSEDFRNQPTHEFDKMVGGIMEVTYNETIQDGKTKEYSLFLPRVDSSVDWFRFDKTVANTFAELK